MAIIVQGNREFIEVEWASGRKVYYVHKVDGVNYTGKSYMYQKCSICGQLVCGMMGGASRHHEMHERKGEVK